jgi:hypothetical protein
MFRLCGFAKEPKKGEKKKKTPTKDNGNFHAFFRLIPLRMCGKKKKAMLV